MSTKLHGERYLRARPSSQALARFIADELHYLDFGQTLRWYRTVLPAMDDADRALLGCNDRFFLLTALCRRSDMLHPWLFARCREVEDAPDGYLDLWARFHGKTSICTHGGSIQEIVRDPEITICILSCTNKVAKPFLGQIQHELEVNEDLKRVYADVLWADPRREAPRWSLERGIVVKRKGNPKEATVEAHGLIDGMPVGKHYRLLDFDDLVTQDLVGSPEMIQKVTERWEMADNLGTLGETRKWHEGTRYSWGDSYGIILERGTLKARVYPATEDGTLDGAPVLLTPERWAQIKDAQRATINAQMLLNPIAGNEAIFRAEWFKPYEIRPTLLNVYIMVDPSKGRTSRSDRTAIAVIGVDVAGNRYLLDGVRHRMNFSERWNHLKRLYQKWAAATGVQMVRVGYERYGAQIDDEIILERQQREGIEFAVEELNWPREGEHSKDDRIGRLEPDFRLGRFFLPAVVWHPHIKDDEGRAGEGGLCFWRVWTQADQDAAVKRGEGKRHNVGQIVYRPYRGPTKTQITCEKTGQGYRIALPIKAIDEDRNVYDLTRALMEELMFHPFSPKKDLIDATSRLYDMEPRPPLQHESEHADQRVYPDT